MIGENLIMVENTNTRENEMNTATATQIAVDFFFSAHKALGSVVLHPETINGETWFAGRVVLGDRPNLKVRKFWAHADRGVIVGGYGLISEDLQDGLRSLAWDLVLEDAELKNAQDDFVLVRR